MKMTLFLAIISVFIGGCGATENHSHIADKSTLIMVNTDSGKQQNNVVVDSTGYDTVNVDGTVVRYKVISKRDTVESHGPGIYCDVVLPDYGPLSSKMIMMACKALGKKLQVNFFYAFRNEMACKCYYDFKNCPPTVSAKMQQDYLGEFVVSTGPPLKPLDPTKQKKDDGHKHHDGCKH